MLSLIGVVVLIVVTLMLFLLRHVFNELPPDELKRQARARDERARKLYKVVVYNQEFEALVFLITSVTIAGGVILLTRKLGVAITFLITFSTVWLVVIWPKLSNLRVEVALASLFAPLISRILRFLHPVLHVIAGRINSNTVPRSRIYQTEDLLNFIELQAEQPDNRIPKEQLQIVTGALTFADKLVRDVMIPRRSIVSAKGSDPIGPVLLEELHKSGHSRFPVYYGKPDAVIGTLFLRDIMDIKHGGKVRDFMRKEVFYVHEEHTLQHVLHAFIKTKHHLFMVIDRFEEIVGIITIEDVLEQIIGKPIMDEFDRFEDIREVAAHAAKKEHAEKTTEVVE